MPSWPPQARPEVAGLFLTWFSRVPEASRPEQLTLRVPGSSPDCTSGFGVLEADFVSHVLDDGIPLMVLKVKVKAKAGAT